MPMGFGGASASLRVVLAAALPAAAAAVGLRAVSTASALTQERGGAAAQSLKARLGPPTRTEITTDVLSLLQQFKSFADESHQGLSEQSAAEAKRLQAAAGIAQEAGVKAVLEKTISSSNASLQESQRVLSSISKFASSMKLVLEASLTHGQSCEDMVCGENAGCTESTTGAMCVCDEGYVGNGKLCHSPEAFRPHRLLMSGSMGLSTRAAEINVAVLPGDNPRKVVVVWRDLTLSNAGRMVVGMLHQADHVEWGQPTVFSESGQKAYNPVVSAVDSGAFAVAWRDANLNGACYLRGGVLHTGIPGAVVTWSKPHQFCNKQSHGLAMFSLPPNRVAVLFSDKTSPSDIAPAEAFGNSLLASVGVDGGISLMGNFRFANQAVTRLGVTMLSPTAFVIAARSLPATDDVDGLNPSASKHQEALAIYGEMDDVDLAYDPNALSLEPNVTEIWARGVSKIAPDTVGYAYQVGTSSTTKLAMIRLNQTLKLMNVTATPKILQEGSESPYVSMVSTPYTEKDPYSMTLYEANNQSMVSICKVQTPTYTLEACNSTVWLKQTTTSVKAVNLGHGELFFVFTTAAGVPYYERMLAAKGSSSY